jgi:hypothetical protein
MQKSGRPSDRARINAPWFLQLQDEEQPEPEETDPE